MKIDIFYNFILKQRCHLEDFENYFIYIVRSGRKSSNHLHKSDIWETYKITPCELFVPKVA
jgi:hypothetical protein